MDPITHGLATRLVAAAALPEEKDRGLVDLATVCGLLPDIDILFSMGDSLAGMQNHRGITHSLFGAALLGLPIAYGARRWRLKDHGFGIVYFVSLAGLLGHIFLDLITSYGTMILEPFTNRRFSLDLWFIIDPYVWLLLLVPVVIRAFRADWRVRSDRIGACLLGGYVLLAVATHTVALARLTRWVRENHLQPLTVGAIPVALSPLHQKGIVITPERAYDIPIALTHAQFGPIATYPPPFRSEDPYIERAWATDAGKVYRWFARFPLATRIEEGGKQRVVLYDLRFQQRYEDLGWLGRLAADALASRSSQMLDHKRMALEVIFDAHARIERIEFLH